MALPVADPNNIGKCVDFKMYVNEGEELVRIDKQGYKIIRIHPPPLGVGAKLYEIQSNFGNGDESHIIKPENITSIYDCPGAGPAGPNNLEMNGGRKKRKNKRKSRKTRKARKASKPTRKHS